MRRARAAFRTSFFTTKDTGTGLAWPLRAPSSSRHGGRIEIRSQIGRGTEVRVLLPVEVREARSAGSDDEPSIAEALRLILERDGYVVETARNITEASARMDGHDFSVALVDLVLPDGDGMGLLKVLKGT